MKIRRIKIIDNKTKKEQIKEVTAEEHVEILDRISTHKLDMSVKLLKERDL